MENMPVELSIIIVNYNSEDCLPACVNSIRKYASLINYEIIIIDNDSPGKDKLPALAEGSDDICIIYSGENKGFGYGCNKGVENSSGNLLLFLNPDTEFKDDSLPRLVKFYKEGLNRGYGAVSPVFTDKDGNYIYSYNRFPNFRWELAEAMGMDGTTIITKEMLEALKSHNDVNGEFETDAFTGACLLTGRNLFVELGGFDENMFLYYEDTDLQKRIREKGLKNVIATSCRIVHTPNTSTKSVNGDIFYYRNLYRSKMIYFHKHLGIFRNIFFRSLHITGILARYITLPFRKKYRGHRIEYSGFYIELLCMIIFNRTC